MKGFRIAARGLIVQNDKLLFVSDDGRYWYLPGGRLEKDESLVECVEREIYEETGLVVKVGALLYTQECFDIKDSTHKIHFYFQTELTEGHLQEHWSDVGGAVQFRRFFTLKEIETQVNILPRFLADMPWVYTSEHRQHVYQGSRIMRGFEMDEALAIACSASAKI